MVYKYTGVNTIDINNCDKMEFSLDFVGAKDDLPKRKNPNMKNMVSGFNMIS